MGRINNVGITMEKFSQFDIVQKDERRVIDLVFVESYNSFMESIVKAYTYLNIDFTCFCNTFPCRFASVDFEG